MRAFYFATQERRLRYGDNRPIVVGETRTVDCAPEPCERGLHASVRPLDALRYAPGATLYLVELGGVIAATERRYLAEFDASALLVRFACDCAREVVEQIRPYTDKYELIVSFLKGPNADAADAARAAYAAADAADAARVGGSDPNGRLLQMLRDATGWDI